MRIVVVSRDGEQREIELIGEVIVCDRTENADSTLNEIRCNGMDYFFTKDGFFDGWGSGCPSVLETLGEPPKRGEAK